MLYLMEDQHFIKLLETENKNKSKRGIKTLIYNEWFLY